ncbi:hypothetical protein AADZ90_022345 [Aestuariibius sp. 2305UL40-4]|uniref:hypothetical protein n=1 Tax=Aestuariibius violaceus TaxID=3234132 RepID=UPI003479CBDE
MGTWKDVTLTLGGACPDMLDGPARLVVALSSQFIHDGTVEDLAARIGSVCSLEELKYWR